MKFSIVVPVYNSESFLRECVESVRMQTEADWELILVDDGSTDASAEIAREYTRRDSRIQMKCQHNSGQLLARRAGLSEAGGDYVLFLDSDDYLREDCLETLAKTIESSGADVVMFCAVRKGETRDKNKIIPVVSDHPQKMEKTHVQQVLISGVEYNSMCLKAWKRTLFQDDQTDYSSFFGMSWGEDKVQHLHPITRAETFYFIPDALYCYRDNPSSVIHDVDLSKVPVMISDKMYALLYAYMKKWDMDTPENRERIAVQYLRNFLSVYYRMRKAYVRQLGEFRSYDWNSVLSESARRYSLSKRLTAKEKVKLVLACFFRF